MKYNWQQPDWPDFHYSLSDLQHIFIAYAEKTGHVNGILKGLPEAIQSEAMIDFMVSEAIKTSEIEGEYLSREDVISSIRNNLGLASSQKEVHDQRAKGAADLMVDVRQTFMDPLAKEALFKWHRMLLPEHPHRITIGAWRTHKEPMQVISGPIGKWKVHFEAPPSKLVPSEMKAFILWFNNTAPGAPQEIHLTLVRCAIAHLYFESIHPFEDGNGRIGRAIAEKALSQGLGRPVLLSLSKTIQANKKAYYAALKTAQRSNEITPWIHYFASEILAAQCEAESQINFALQKTKFFDHFREQLSERHLKVVRRMLEESPNGFEGGMTAKKYIAITKVSKATATRDLQYLTEIGTLKQTGGGRSIRYEINLKT